MTKNNRSGCSLFLVEVFQRPRRARPPGLGRGWRVRVRGGLIGGTIGGTPRLGNQLIDRDIPGHMTDRHDGDLLARVKSYNSAGPIIAQARYDHPVAGLNSCSRLGQVAIAASLLLEVSQTLLECLAGALGLGLGPQRRLACFLRVLA